MLLSQDGLCYALGAARWIAPEVMKPADIPRRHKFHSKATEVWGFGMVVYVCIDDLLCFVPVLYHIAESAVGEDTTRESLQ